MIPWVSTLIGNTARGVRRNMIASALAALAFALATASVVDLAELMQMEASAQTALDAAALGAAIAYGDGVARSETEARDVALQIFRSSAPLAATAEASAVSVEVRRRGGPAVMRYEGALETRIGTYLHLGAARVRLRARAEARANGRLAGAAGSSRSDPL